MIPYCILVMEDEDDRAFMTELFLQYHRLMFSQINQIVQDNWAAEDVVQNVLLKLIEKVEDLKTKDRDHLVNYIISACKNRARNYVRDNSTHIESSLDEYADIPDTKQGRDKIEAGLIRADELNSLFRIWPKLDERSQLILEGYYILGKSSVELAEELGIQPNSVRMALTRARKNAYRLLEQEHET